MEIFILSFSAFCAAISVSGSLLSLRMRRKARRLSDEGASETVRNVCEALRVVATGWDGCGAKVMRIDGLAENALPAIGLNEGSQGDDRLQLVCAKDCKMFGRCPLTKALMNSRDGKVKPRSVGLLRVKSYQFDSSGFADFILDDYPESQAITIASASLGSHDKPSLVTFAEPDEESKASSDKPEQVAGNAEEAINS